MHMLDAAGMEIDPYKFLLRSASREQLKRQSDMNGRLVGNVFLPAIHKCNKEPLPSSLKHLEVIEQCIMAENKREERLAKCQNEKERRHWSKTFQAQRNHERALIQTLMVGTSVDAAFEVTNIEVVASVAPSRSPLLSNVDHGTTGITASVPHPDRVFHKAKFTGVIPKTKPHARKKFTLPDCQGSPNKVKPYPRPTPTTETAPKHARSLPFGSVPAGASPHRGSRSASSSRVSPTKAKAPDTTSPPPALSKSRLKQNRPQAAEKAQEWSPKKKLSKPAKLLAQLTSDTDQHRTDDVLLFGGSTSFLEAQQVAMTALSDTGDYEVACTQTAQEGSVDVINASREAGSDHKSSCSVGTTSLRTKTSRPRSCPAARQKLHQGCEESIPHSHSDTAFSLNECFRTDRVLRGVPQVPDAQHTELDTRQDVRNGEISICDEADSQTSDGHEAEVQDGVTDQEAGLEDHAADEATSSLPDGVECDEGNVVEQEDAISSATHSIALEDDLKLDEATATETEDSVQASSDRSAHSESQHIPIEDHNIQDEEAEMEVAEVLFDLVDQISADFSDDVDSSILPALPQSPDSAKNRQSTYLVSAAAAVSLDHLVAERCSPSSLTT